MYELKWKAGPSVEGVSSLQPTLAAATAQKFWGRLHQRELKKTWAFDESGRFSQVVDYTFDTSEGRDMVRGPAQALGWKERMPLTAKIGLVFTIFGVAVAVITMVALIVVALLGAF